MVRGAVAVQAGTPGAKRNLVAATAVNAQLVSDRADARILARPRFTRIGVRARRYGSSTYAVPIASSTRSPARRCGLRFGTGGMPLEALRRPITPIGMYYVLVHFDLTKRVHAPY